LLLSIVNVFPLGIGSQRGEPPLLLRSEYKVKGGKLIKVTLEVEGDVIKNAKICGDFFLYPEDVIEHIEQALKGARSDSKLEQILAEVVKRSGAQLLGFSVDDIAAAIRLAFQSRLG
jgi:lipoate-protein ligase A